MARPYEVTVVIRDNEGRSTKRSWQAQPGQEITLQRLGPLAQFVLAGIAELDAVVPSQEPADL